MRSKKIKNSIFLRGKKNLRQNKIFWGKREKFEEKWNTSGYKGCSNWPSLDYHCWNLNIDCVLRFRLPSSCDMFEEDRACLFWQSMLKTASPKKTCCHCFLTFKRINVRVRSKVKRFWFYKIWHGTLRIVPKKVLWKSNSFFKGESVCGHYISEQKKKNFSKLMLFRQVKGLFIAI